MPSWRKRESQCLLNAFSTLFKGNEAVWNFNDLVYEIPSHRVNKQRESDLGKIYICFYIESGLPLSNVIEATVSKLRG